MHWPGARASINQVGRVRCEPGWRLDWIDPAWLSDCDLWFVWAGRGRMKLTEGEEIDLHAGVCLWMRPGRTYQASQNPIDPLGVTYVHFDLWRSARRRTPLAALPPEVHVVRDFAFVDAATRRVVELVRDSNFAAASSSRFEAESLLMSVLAGLDRCAAEERSVQQSTATTENRRRISQVVSAITENPAAVPAIGELARRCGYSPVHFSRVFREIMGEPPQAFVIKSRLQRARQLLTESSLSIGEIARMLGYPDVFFFSRQFKAKSGQSPNGFRNAC